MPAQLGLQGVIERIAGLLVPEQPVRLHRLGVADGGLQVKAPVGIDRQILAVADHLERRFDASDVVLQRRAADLHLYDLVAHAAVAPPLLPQGAQVLAGVVVAAGAVDADAYVPHAVAPVTTTVVWG